MDGVSREIRLVARPHGFPGEELFEVAETPIPDPAEGQVLIRNAYFSVDPYMRPRMNDVRSYVAPFTLGEAMTGGAVGRVAVSRNSRYRGGRLGVAPARLARVGALGRRGASPLDPTAAPVSTRSASSGCRVHRVVRPVRAREAAGGGDRLRLGRGGRRRQRRGSDGGDRGLPRHRQRRLAGEARMARASSASTPPSTTGSDPREGARGAARPTASTSTSTTSAATISRRRSARCEPRTRRRMRLDLALQRRRGVAGAAQHVHGRDEASPAAGVHHQRPLRALRRVRAGGGRVGARRPAARIGRRSSTASRTRRKAFLGLLRGENIGKMLVKVGPAE